MLSVANTVLLLRVKVTKFHIYYLIDGINFDRKKEFYLNAF